LDSFEAFSGFFMDMFLNCHFSNQSIQKAAIAQAFMAVFRDNELDGATPKAYEYKL
jgi:hypothetical protein